MNFIYKTPYLHITGEGWLEYGKVFLTNKCLNSHSFDTHIDYF